MSAATILARAAKVRREISAPGDLLLAARIGLWAVALRMLKHVIPLAVLVRAVRRPAACLRRDEVRERKIVVLARWGCRILAWSAEDSCLERALVSYRYLTSAGAAPHLVVGLGRANDRIRGHSWVTVDGRAVDDTEETLAGFEVITAFGPDGVPVPANRR
jgi:Transglutaminase-like superfamily